jgi:hypothetical protein
VPEAGAAARLRARPEGVATLTSGGNATLTSGGNETLTSGGNDS